MSHVRIGWMDYPPEDCRGGAVTVGNFDGVHLGHRALVNAAKRHAEIAKGPAVVVNFDPPPQAVLNPDPTKQPLTTVEQRAKLLLAAGADRVVTIRTDAGLLSLSPEAFFEDVLHRQLNAKAIIEGADFRFGRKRAGDVELLKRLCNANAIAFDTVTPVLIDGEVVSSSRVRMALLDGKVDVASKLLDRPYAITGTVVTGAMRGRTIGFPTANLDGVETIVPGVGVYAMRVNVNGQAWPAAANVGPNPTFGEDRRKIELHLIGFTGYLYGEQLTAEFIGRIRETRPFAGVEALKEQLKIDVAQAVKMLT
jgi:riboflavin kinase/FMN adenylyltransferase